MNLEDQVIFLELSIKLKGLGIEKKSLFYHYNEPYNDGVEDWVTTTWDEYVTTYENKSEPYPAFSVAELMDLLPCIVTVKQKEPFDNYWLHIEKRSSLNIRWIVSYLCDSYCPPEFIQYRLTKNMHDEKLADALAKMLIYLIENKLYDLNS
jgi:hypothetical protein